MSTPRRRTEMTQRTVETPLALLSQEPRRQGSPAEVTQGQDARGVVRQLTGWTESGQRGICVAEVVAVLLAVSEALAAAAAAAVTAGAA